MCERCSRSVKGEGGEDSGVMGTRGCSSCPPGSTWLAHFSFGLLGG